MMRYSILLFLLEERRMKRTACVVSTVLGMLLVALGATPAPAAEVMTRTEQVTWYDVQLKAVKTADNFIVLFNTAKTMGEPYGQTGMSHLQAARKLLAERNKSLPNLTYQAGLYTFAPPSATYTEVLKAYYPMQPYNKEAFAKAIAQLPTEARGRTEIQRALLGLEPVLKTLSGKTMVFLFTDGVNTEIEPPHGLLLPNQFARTPRELASDLAEQYDVCFQVISSAPGEIEKRLVEAVSQINECSRVVPLDDLLEHPDYITGALFVMNEQVLKVIETQEKVVGFKMDNILFDFNSAAIKPAYTDELDALGTFLQAHPPAYVILVGFTDPVGSSEYNWQLSRRRVESVRQYLQRKFQLASDRIVTLWYGDLAPVAPNDTAEGRSQNRRVAGVVAGL
jgi:OOP family OmpA-OmpF porin